MKKLNFQAVYRVRKTDEYSSVFAFRKTIRGRYFTLHYSPPCISEASTTLSLRSSARLGLVVPRKQARFAVQRNLIKRLAREIFRQARSELPVKDLVLRLTQKVDDVTRVALREDIASLLARVR